MPPDRRRRLDGAIAARESLLSDKLTNACRVFNGVRDGIDGLVIERFGDVLIAQLHEGRLTLDEREARACCAHVADRLGARAVYRKMFARDRTAAPPAVDQGHHNPVPWIGTAVDEEIVIHEHGARYVIRPYDGYSVGLFLEHRENRRQIRALAGGRRVLNTFAYTCAFSVSAALGGAAETVSVDIAKRTLDWGKRNFLANDLTPDDHKFRVADTLDFCRRAQRRQERFDLVILDPPSFSRARNSRRVFNLDAQLDELVAAALPVIAPGGLLLLATNHRTIRYHRLEQALRRACAGRKLQSSSRQKLPPDFQNDPDYSKSILAEIG